MQPIVLCADDYGLSPGIDAAILDLGEKKCLDAVSCMTVFPEWKVAGGRVKSLRNSVDIGLHFTLTGPAARPLSSSFSKLLSDGRFLPYSEFLRQALLRRLNEELVYLELVQQVAAFEAEVGFEPAFIDGHQHIHQLPVVRDAVIRLLKERNGRIYTRNNAVKASQVLRQKRAKAKGLLLSLPGWVWKRKLLRENLPTNDGFTGIYNLDFRKKEEIKETFFNFADTAVGSSPIWMVHPGVSDSVLHSRDTFTQGREIEYQILGSQEFTDHLLKSKIQRSRFLRK